MPAQSVFQVVPFDDKPYLLSSAGPPAILCLCCLKISSNPNDMAYHYCNFCHAFMEILDAETP